MARLWASKNQMYVPTDGVALERLGNHVERAKDGLIRIADFGCGTGACLLYLQEKITGQIESYGVELNTERGNEAKKLLTHVCIEDTMQMRVDPESFGLVNLNPPYDEGKMEAEWFQFIYPMIQKGGTLIFTVSRKNLRHNTCDTIARHFENFQIYAYPETQYDQVFIICQRKQRAQTNREMALFLRLVAHPEVTVNIKKLVQWQYEEVQDWVHARIEEAKNIPELPADPPMTFLVPPVKSDVPIRFFARKVDHQEVVQRMTTSPLLKFIDESIYCKSLRDRKLEPLMPITGAGHFKALLDAGVFDGEVIRSADGKDPLLITTGGGRKLIERTDRAEHSITHVQYEKPVSKLVAWTVEGNLEVFTG